MGLGDAQPHTLHLSVIPDIPVTSTVTAALIWFAALIFVLSHTANAWVTP